MIKKIYINESQTVDINTSAAWLYTYKSAFGHDILPELLPALQGIGQTIAVLYDEETGTIPFSKAAEAIGSGELLDAMSPFYGLEFTTIINILWACVKSADIQTPPVEDWVQDKDINLDMVVPELLDAIPETFVSSKNLEWLKGALKKTTNLSRSTSSQSEQSQEG